MKCNAVNFIGCLTRRITPQEIKSLRFAPEYLPDTVQISKKSALTEFKNYLEGWKLRGEDFVPHSDNPNSTFMEYFRFRERRCKEQSEVRVCDGLILPAGIKQAKVVVKGEPIESLMLFKNFMRESSQFATKEEYYEVIDEIARLMPEYAGRKNKGLRPEIVERSGDIFRWASYLDVEKKVDGELVQMRFFDRDKKERALAEYVRFVEDLTGKKVLVGGQTRLNAATNGLGILNDPNSYKDVDYILFGHGKGASLITDTSNPDTWRFSDSGESVWEFIEQNVSEGKKVLAITCEKDRFWTSGRVLPRERLEMPEMYDKSGSYMLGIGNTVSYAFTKDQPAKILQSGIRHIIGHTAIEHNKGKKCVFLDSNYGETRSVYYDL